MVVDVKEEARFRGLLLFLHRELNAYA